MVEGARLEIVCTAMYRGFESRSLRHPKPADRKIGGFSAFFGGLPCSGLCASHGRSRFLRHSRGSRQRRGYTPDVISDTRPEARAILTALYRKAGQERCLRMALQMSADYRAVAVSGIRFRRPDATETEVRRELARILLGEDLARRVYGAEPT